MIKFKLEKLNLKSFWRFFFLLLLFSIFLCIFFIYPLVNDEKEKSIQGLLNRAQVLMLAIEGATRVKGQDDLKGLQEILPEMAKQPGIVWVALVNQSGEIVADSSRQLTRQILYTPGELEALNPGAVIQGAISPDEPDIFETWKIFEPGRMRRGKKHLLNNYILFVALDAAPAKKQISAYERQLILIGALGSGVFLASFALLFFIFNYRASKKELADVRSLALQVIKSYPAAFIASDEKGDIVISNESAKKLLNLTSKSAKIQDLPGSIWKSGMDDLEKGPIIDRRVTLSLNDKIIPLSLSAAPIKDSLGKINGFLFILESLEEINSLKEKLAQSTRQITLGNLAIGLAHEIRNPLSSISGYVCYLENRLADDPMGLATARLLVEEVERLNSVLTNLLTLARPEQPNLKLQPLNEILKKAVQLTLPDAQAHKHILRLNLPDHACEAVVDGDRMLQALLNIILNAIQVMKGKGEIKISLDAVEMGDKKMWRIQIADNGPGMDEKTLKQIFMPYFTTRARGTGLGLAITKKIVESQNGDLNVESAPGQGALFSILLPAIETG